MEGCVTISKNEGRGSRRDRCTSEKLKQIQREKGLQQVIAFIVEISYTMNKGKKNLN